jgi:competence protein ComEC
MAKDSVKNNFRIKNFMPVFQKQPFLFLFIFLSTGVFIGNQICSLEILLTSLTISLFTYLFYLNAKNHFKKIILQLSIGTSFFFLGYLSYFFFETQSFQLYSIQNPTSFQMKVIEFQPKSDSWSKGIGEISILSDEKNQGKKERIVFYCKSSTEFDVNDHLLLNADLIQIENKGNPGEFDLQLYWKGKGIRKMCFFDQTNFKLLDRQERTNFQNFFFSLQSSFNQTLEKHLTGENLAIGKALILGDKSMLDSETKNSFSATGAMHVLAVSGLHIGLILQILLVIASQFSRFISRKKAIFIILILLWIYSILTGFSPSVIRSIFMFTILVLSQNYGKNLNNLNSLFFSAFVLILIEPMFLFDIGFQLSYLAMVGIFTLYKPIEKWYQPKNKILKYFWQGTAIGFAAQCMTVPLTLYYFHQFPNYFALANLGLMLISGAVLGFGIAIFALHYIPLLGKLMGYLLFLSIAIMLWFIQWVEHLPGAVAYGFNVPFFIVPIVSFLLFLLIQFKPQQIVWKISAIVFVISLLFIVAKRWQFLTENHLYILNQNKLTFLIKKKDQILCFYNDKSENLNKVKFTTESYLKCYPGEIKYYSLKNKNYNLVFDSLKLNITKNNPNYTIEFNDHKIQIIHSEKNKVKMGYKNIYMPWIENKNSLRNGSLFFPL